MSDYRVPFDIFIRSYSNDEPIVTLTVGLLKERPAVVEDDHHSSSSSSSSEQEQEGDEEFREHVDV